MKVSALIIAHAQVWFFTMSLVGFIGLMYILFLGQVHLDATTEKLAYTMFGVLGTIVTQQSGYFYSRQRPDGSAITTETKTP